MDSLHTRVQRLRKGVHVDVDACLARRPASIGCGACVDVCPTDALSWSHDSVLVESWCLECGRCAAACPGGAISVGGFDAPMIEPAAIPRELWLECGRVPSHLRRRASHTVPCLGGITALSLLEHAARGYSVVLLDRGWCAKCPQGRDKSASMAEVVADALFDLRAATGGARAAGVLPLPRIDQVPLPASVATAPPSGGSLSGVALDRRGFFSALRGGARSIAAAASRPRHTRTRAACRPSEAVRQHLADRAGALAAVARRVNRPLSAAAFPAVTAHGHCCHEGVCAAACPSGALRVVEDDASGQVGLDINASLCLGCGLCAQLCPHGALSVTAAGQATETLQPGPRALTRHTLRACSQCRAGFIPRDDSGLCPRCAMAHAQARSLFGTLLTGSASRNAFPSS